MEAVESQKFFSKKIEKKEMVDTGMVLALVLLIVFFATKNILYVKIAVGVLLVAVIWPVILKPVAVVWFGVSEILGSIVSRVILGLIFIVFVLPMAFFRRMIGKDPMRFKSWKHGDQSVFHVRNQTFSQLDINKPY